MSRKKTTKRLVAEYADFLADLTTEQLKAVKVRFGVTVPSFKVTVASVVDEKARTDGGGS